MTSKKKKIEDEQSAPKILTGDDINIEELFARLKEFENKALLDRLKALESSISAIHKMQMIDRALLKDIKQHVAYLSLAHEELLNNIGKVTAICKESLSITCIFLNLFLL